MDRKWLNKGGYGLDMDCICVERWNSYFFLLIILQLCPDKFYAWNKFMLHKLCIEYILIQNSFRLKNSLCWDHFYAQKTHWFNAWNVTYTTNTHRPFCSDHSYAQNTFNAWNTPILRKSICPTNSFKN